MRILLICRDFAPDNIISAKRLTKFAKYLSIDNEIFVICSGKIYGKYSKESLKGVENVHIYNYDVKNTTVSNRKKNSKCNCGKIASILKRIIRIFIDPFIFYFYYGVMIKNKIIKTYEANSEIANIDIVLSTFSPVGCLMAGKYIKSREKCKWIIDFRDLMTNMMFTSLLRKINFLVQKKYVYESDLCLTVSIGNKNALIQQYPKCENKIYTVFNGYDKDEEVLDCGNGTDNNVMTICYTGTMYGGMRDISPLFKAIANIKDKVSVKIRFLYAGSDGYIVKEKAMEYGLEYIIEDCGMLSKEEVVTYQKKSDLFLVITWNTIIDQGILTGKFYESLLIKKPVIGLVSGDMPNSELKMLIEKYNLGICYENGNSIDNEQEQLEQYLIEQCEAKKIIGHVIYEPKHEVFSKFAYEEIVSELKELIKKI